MLVIQLLTESGIHLLDNGRGGVYCDEQSRCIRKFEAALRVHAARQEEIVEDINRIFFSNTEILENV
jgi:hypothetical protein